MDTLIEQVYYPHLEIDNKERDIVQIFQKGEVIQIERESIAELITLLKAEIK